jgi:small subunit ribosomal protein S1
MSREEDLRSEKSLGGVPEVQIELPDADFVAPDPGELEHLMADLDKAPTLPTGEIVPGKVLKVTDTEVIVDLGLKTEAAIPLVEFQTDDGRVTVEAGDSTDLWIEQFDESEGLLRVSRLKAARVKVWDEIERAFRDQSPLTGRVIDHIKGGLIVDLGVKAFLPSSQADLRPLRNPDALMGQEIAVKVVKVARKRSNVVVSRKQILEEEARQRKQQLLARLYEGAEVTGRVKNLTSYGAFLDLGGMDGLLHVTDLAWERVAAPADVLQVGQELTVKVLKVDTEKERISLGLKQLTPDPWEHVPAQYQVGDRVTGRVVSLTDYGAFIEIEPGVEGLLHVSEMTWSRHLKHPSKILRQGDSVEVAVLEVRPQERRLSLSLKRTLPDPWEEAAARFPVGTEVEAQVRSLTDFGAFVEIVAGVEGLIHISEMSWTKKLKHPSDILKKGQKIKAVVLRVAPEERRISLGLKQLEADPWEEFLARTQVGDKVRGTVVRKAAFGVFVSLGEAIEGLCHNSELGPGGAEIGSEYEFRVIRVSGGEKKIGLSRKEAARAAVASPPAAAPKPPERPMTTMAAAFTSAGITAASLAAPASRQEKADASGDGAAPPKAGLSVADFPAEATLEEGDGQSAPEPPSSQPIPMPQGVTHDES